MRYDTAISQFSPGDLSRAHASLSGMQNCTSCHEVGNEISGQKCLGCHTEIAELRNRPTSFHASFKAKQCIDCHKEHLGKDAKTVQFEKVSFDHMLTGFMLTGKHSTILCEQCHSEKYITVTSVKDKLKKFPHDTYLGLSGACFTCHKDPHNGKFKNDCSSCHTTSTWTAIQGFDHSKTKFPLTGKHLPVSCAKCHPSINEKQVKTSITFGTKEFSDCTPCHTSPHKAKFTGQTCASCHTPLGWSEAMQKPFDHKRTSYALLGKHAALQCTQCHRISEKKSFAETFFLPFQKCIDCHEDTHRGDFMTAHKNDCAVCHTQDRFSPSTFTLMRHQKTDFALTGAHTATLCGQCHKKGDDGKPLSFHFTSLKCETCHKDVHKGQFASMMKEQSCGKCHSTEQWKSSSFDHSTTSFTLTGKHAMIPCSDCHKELSTQSGKMQFKKLSMDCQSCHKDIHESQFAVDTKTICSQCHSSLGWKQLVFDHEKQSKFSLRGAHQKVACKECHKTEMKNSNQFVRYKPLASTCESCHQGKDTQ
jgi:hypothetical protein